ncbi:MAG: hypothetical protein JRK26_06525 [Deltaproteobacteria bacterium]|nr:hypothetical protein [Deltaproteobacteria bacterium]
MPLEIAKIVDEKELEGEELLENLVERTKKYEIRAIQDKRLIFTRVRTYLEKIFGSFYTTEKNEPMVLIAQALVRLRQNPHLKGREEKISQLRRLFDNLKENGLLKLRHGQSEEFDYTVISQRLSVSINGEEEKTYEIVRKIPSAHKSAEEEKQRLITYREELKLIDQARLTCKQIDGLISQPMEDEIKQQAVQTVRDYFQEIEQKLYYAHCILTGNGYIEDDFIAALKLESLDLAEEMKDKSMIEKMIFLTSLNWYRHKWASNSFNEPDNLVYFLIGRMIFRHAPWNPKGKAEIREALENIEISCADLERTFVRQASGEQSEENDSPIKVDRRKEKILQLIKQLIALRNTLGSRKSVLNGNTLLKKFLRPGIRTPVSVHNMEIIAEEIKSQVKIDCLGKIMREFSFDKNIKKIVGHLRQALSEANMELFQQLQAFRVAHGLGNLADNKERERIAAFISPMDVVQFLTALSNGNITITEATEEKVVFIARGSSGETLDTSTRTLTSKGVTYDEAANWINKEFENILLNYEKPDFESRCADCNPSYTRETDEHIKIKNYAWVCRRFPFLKMFFGASALLVSPIMYNIMEGERDKEEKTIHKSTAAFMEKVIELEHYLLERIESATEKLQVSVLDKNRVESQMFDDGTRPLKTALAAGGGDARYTLLLEEGVREVFPKLNFELQVLVGGIDENTEEGAGPHGEDGRTLTEEERAFDEKYSHLMTDAQPKPDTEEEAPKGVVRINPRSIQRLSVALENLGVFYEGLKSEGYERRIPVMRRDQIVANIRDACYYIKDIVKNLTPESKDAAELLRKTDDLLQKTRDSIQRTEIIEEKINVEEENVEVPLYEIHSILVTINSSYMITLKGLIELIAQKHKTTRGGLIKVDQIDSSKKILDNIESAFNTLIRNSREIKLESPKIPMGLRDVMSLNITSAIGEINRLKRSQLIIQSCQHPNDLRIYLNVIARQILESKLMVPLQNIQISLKKCPTYIDDNQYPIWRPEGEEKMSSSIFGQMDVPQLAINDVPKVLRSVISISDQLADHLIARGHEFRQKMASQNETPPERSDFDVFADRMTKGISGALGHLHAFFIPDKDNNITFDPENLENILRVIGTCVGEMIFLFKDFSKNRSAFAAEIDAIRKIVPVLEGLRNCVNDYNANYLKQKKTADLARSKTNCDKTLIGYCQELTKYDDPTTLEYKLLVIRGRVYILLENAVQRILGQMKSEFNAERKKQYQILLNEIFYMMSHVKVETRDLPLFKKFRQSALRAASQCGNEQLKKEVANMLEKSEEIADWVRAAASGFDEKVINEVYTPGVDLERLRKLGDSI